MTGMRERIVEEALGWVGTPYHHAARIKGVGVDCAQLLIGVYAAVGLIEAFDPGHYVQDWALHRSEQRFLGWVLDKGAVQVACGRPGDILLFEYGRCYSHGAILVDDRLMVHSFIGRGVELVELDEFRLKRFAAFTLPGVGDGR